MPPGQKIRHRARHVQKFARGWNLGRRGQSGYILIARQRAGSVRRGPVSSSATRSIPAGLPSGGLSVVDGIALLVGVVVGIGIFGFPPLVAQHADSPGMYMAFWVVGAVLMLIGALCYAELGSAYPHQGGEYHYLTRAWGPRVGFLFAWSRGMVVQTGSIAAAAFIYGEYANDLMPLGSHGPALHAAIAVVGTTVLNMLGTRESKNVQHVFTALTLGGVAAVIVAGLLVSGTPAMEAVTAPGTSAREGAAGAWGMGLILVLLTYGGWNEAAYLSGELENPGRNVSRVLVIGTLIVAACYILANLAFLEIFGLAGLRQTHAVAADLMRVAAGPSGATTLGLLVSLTALCTINSSILTGARVYFALGRDLPKLRALGQWHQPSRSPRRALLVQAAIVLALIVLALVAAGHSGGNAIETMVAYTAPVFWMFMLLVALSVWRLRVLDPDRPRPFKVPLYPLTPLVFALACAALTWASVRYAGLGALLGLTVLAAGLPLLGWTDRGGRKRREQG